MIWLTWRQLRTQAWVALIALGVFAIALAVTAPGLRDLYDVTGAAACRADCDRFTSDFLDQAQRGTAGWLYWVGFGLVSVVPAMVGIFWGAPMVARELEAGTHRLTWNQSVTRTRWLSTKLLGGALGAAAAAGLFTLALSWWAGPIDDAAGNRLLPEVFGARGVVPIGYAALAFVLGATIGTVLRRTIPAMAVTLLLVAAAQLAMPFLVRGHLMTPVQITAPFESRNIKSLYLTGATHIEVTAKVDVPGAWVVSNKTVTPDGEVFAGPYDNTACGAQGNPQACNAWLDKQQLRQVAQYQPADRFWALQWIELALLVALTAAAGGACLWWVTRRLN